MARETMSIASGMKLFCMFWSIDIGCLVVGCRCVVACCFWDLGFFAVSCASGYHLIFQRERKIFREGSCHLLHTTLIIMACKWNRFPF